MHGAKSGARADGRDERQGPEEGRDQVVPDDESDYFQSCPAAGPGMHMMFGRHHKESANLPLLARLAARMG